MGATRQPDGRQFWERVAGRYDRSMRLFGRPLPRAIELTCEAVDGAGEVLEVAAGTGLFTAAVAPRVGRLVASDDAAAMVAVLAGRVAAARLANVSCARADLYALPHPPASFDAVVAANVLHLVPDLPAALAALRCVLRPGGTLAAPTFCHHQSFRSRLLSRLLALAGQPMHRRFTAASLAGALADAGFEVTLTETVPGPIPIGLVAAR